MISFRGPLVSKVHRARGALQDQWAKEDHRDLQERQEHRANALVDYLHETLYVCMSCDVTSWYFLCSSTIAIDNQLINMYWTCRVLVDQTVPPEHPEMLDHRVNKGYLGV